MQVQYLKEVVSYLEKLTDENNLIKNYEQFCKTLQKAESLDKGEAIKMVNKDIENILFIHQQIEPHNWCYVKYEIYKEINKDGLWGQDAITKLKTSFDIDKLDIPTMIETAKGMTSDLKKIYKNLLSVQSLNNICNNIKILENGRNMIYIYFTGNVSIKDLNDLEKYSRIWNAILLNFCQLVGETETEIAIDDIDSYSNSIAVSSGVKTTKALAFAVKEMLEIYNWIYKVRNIQSDVMLLNLNDNIIYLLEQEVDKYINEHYMSITERLLNDNEKNGDEEICRSILMSLKQIIDFIEKGGRIDFKPEEGIDYIDNNEINKKYEQLSAIKEIMIRIENYGRSE